MKPVFAPGCALMIYKPILAEKLRTMLDQRIGSTEMRLACCRHVPPLAAGTEIISVCPGCDKRYRENYRDAANTSLWEVLAKSSRFSFPDYRRQEMTIIDACPTRDQPRVHDAVRELIRKMNITLVEPCLTRTKSTCCGDTFWGNIPTPEVVNQMKKKASEMPVDDVIVYCVSCAKAMFVGNRRPRYLVDLLFSEETVPKTFEPDAWHRELDDFINTHT